MVFNEQAVPPVVIDHQVLPLVEDLLDLIGVPVSQSHAEAGLIVVDVDHLEDENHVELATFSADNFQDFVFVPHERHFADRDGVILAEHFTVHGLQPFVKAWTVCVPFVTRLVLVSRRRDGCIWVSRGL
jgi:hypothetical protein